MILGYLKGSFEAWKEAGEEIDMIIDIEADELAMDLPHDPNLVVLDVRRETEFGDGHIVDAVNIPLDEMTDIVNISDFEENQNIYIHCGTGYRSVIAASLMKRQGLHNLRNIVGGFEKIREQKGIKIVKEDSVLN
jgi:rhodanese-related sulfurtransferase